MTSDTPRRTTVQLDTVTGTLACPCGYDIILDGPTTEIACPRCARVWTITATITPGPHRPANPQDSD